MTRLSCAHFLSVNMLELLHSRQVRSSGCAVWIQTPVSMAARTLSPPSLEPFLGTLYIRCCAYVAMRPLRQRLQLALIVSADFQCRKTTSLEYTHMTSRQAVRSQICSTCLNLIMQLVALTMNLIRSLHRSYRNVMMNVSLRLLYD